MVGLKAEMLIGGVCNCERDSANLQLRTGYCDLTTSNVILRSCNCERDIAILQPRT